MTRAKPDAGPQPPPIPSYPPAPDWSRGLCTTVPQRMRMWWTSGDRDEREAARRMCAGCPVLDECEAWSMCLPATDSAIYAGLSSIERLRRRRAVMRQIAIQALARLSCPQTALSHDRGHASEADAHT